MTKKQKQGEFGEGFAELAQIVAWFEQGEPDLEEGIKKFERAMELTRALKVTLTSAKNRIKEIQGGKNVHNRILERNPSADNAIVKCRARKFCNSI